MCTSHHQPSDCQEILATHGKVSFRKWIPPGRDNNRRVASSIPPCRKSLSDPVSLSGAGGWVAVSSQLEPSPSAIEVSWEVTTVRSSRRGNERMRSKIRGSGTAVGPTWRDLRAGENPWNGTREDGGPVPSLGVPTFSDTTQEKPVIQPPASASPAVTTSRQPTDRVLAQCAGDVEGSGNVFFHDSRTSTVGKSTVAKRCIRVCGTHDLETKQQFLNTSSVSCR
jgi:hypothetical protein